MSCKTVRTRLAGYLDDALVSAPGLEERRTIGQHLDLCEGCREELQRYRRLSVLLSRVPRAVPPSDLAVRIRVAAAQAQETQGWQKRWQRIKDRSEILLDNVFRPLTVPATGGLFSAFIIFVFVLHMIVPGITVRADPNDIPTGLLQPAELIALSDYPESVVAQMQHPDLELQNDDLLVDVTVSANGQMSTYDILSGSNSPDVRHQLDQVLIFSRFRPMLSFGRPTAGGHVVLSFSAVHVRG
ncbi:MAG: zf-HC2 domain-containing protein [Candidatus Acidiferrum sp.]